MAGLFLRTIVRQGRAVLSDAITEFAPHQPLAACLPPSLGPHAVASVSLHRSDPLECAGDRPAGTQVTLATPVAVCQQFGLFTVLVQLTDAPPRPRPRSLMEAVVAGDLEVVQQLYPEATPSERREALDMAVLDGRVPVVKFLLNEGVALDADEEGWTPLLHAAANGHVEVVQLLLAAGADPAAADAEFQRTAVAWAVVRQRPDMVAVLLRAGSPLDTFDREGLTPLMLAALHHHTAAVAQLLEARAAPDAHRPGGQTALMLCAGRGDVPLLQQLLEAKANVAAEAESGTTALLLAVWGGHQAAVALLQAHGAQPPPAAGITVEQLLQDAEREAQLHRVCGDCSHHEH
eukprot:EG_transcript_15473